MLWLKFPVFIFFVNKTLMLLDNLFVSLILYEVQNPNNITSTLKS